MTARQKIEDLLNAVADAGYKQEEHYVVISADLEREFMAEIVALAQKNNLDPFPSRVYVCHGMKGVAVVHGDFLEGFIDHVIAKAR
jgi:hypothetical protein